MKRTAFGATGLEGLIARWDGTIDWPMDLAATLDANLLPISTPTWTRPTCDSACDSALAPWRRSPHHSPNHQTHR